MLSVVGLTVTLTELTVGGRTGAVTVTEALPVFPSLVARIVEVPAAIAAIVPEALIVAIDGTELDQAMVRPVRTLPCASVSVTTAWDCPPTATVLGVTTTDTAAIAGGGGVAIASVDAPDTPSAEAMMVTLPEPIAVTTPAADTVASVGSTLDHWTVRPVSVLPAASRRVATACDV